MLQTDDVWRAMLLIGVKYLTYQLNVMFGGNAGVRACLGPQGTASCVLPNITREQPLGGCLSACVTRCRSVNTWITHTSRMYFVYSRLSDWAIPEHSFCVLYSVQVNLPRTSHDSAPFVHKARSMASLVL